MAIISLTSIPPRFKQLQPVVESLLSQVAPADEVRLYLPRRYRRFPEYEGQLPELPKSVRIVIVEDDFGPASKVLHAASELSGEDIPILFCDDDRIYPRNWSQGLLEAYYRRPNECIAIAGRHLHDLLPEAVQNNTCDRAKIGKEYFDPVYRYRRMRQQWQEKRLITKGQKPARRLVARAGYVDLLQGYGGVLVLPTFIDALFYSIPNDLWMVDDIWLSGHLARRNIPIWLPKRREICQRSENDHVAALRNSTFSGIDRDGSNLRAISYFQQTYGVWDHAIST